jgi:hypothetical protein
MKIKKKENSFFFFASFCILFRENEEGRGGDLASVSF